MMRCLQMIKSFSALALLSCAAVLCAPVQAQNVDASLNKVETFLGYTDQAAPGQLPVSQAEFKQYRTVFKHCLASQDADDVILCVDAFLDTPAGKEVAEELPSWTPVALDIYMDIRNDDFWGLARDVGMFAACIGAQVITGGVDICGLIQALVDMAKEAYANAVKAYEFLSDLGSTVSDAAEKVYCWFSDCSGDGPPPEAVAWANFWHPRIPTGTAMMKSSGDPAKLDALSVNFINSEGLVLKVQNPKVYNALSGTRAQYIEAVKLQWDAQILQEVIPALAKVRQSYELPDKAQQLAKSGFNAAKPGNGLISEPWQMASWRKQAAANVSYFCYTAMSDARARHVSRWVKDGRAAKLGSSEKGAEPEALCAPNLQLAQPYYDNIHRETTRALLLAKGCTAQGNTYTCDSVQMDTTCDFAADYFKSGFACQVDWRKAVAKLMEKIPGCAPAAGDQVYQCVSWPGQEGCVESFTQVQRPPAQHCQLDKLKADAALAQLQIAQLSTFAHPCVWEGGQIVCRRDLQHGSCLQLQQSPFYPTKQLHALTCALKRELAYELAVQLAQQLRAAMAGVGLNGGAQTRSYSAGSSQIPAMQVIGAQSGQTGGSIQWLGHADPLMFLADTSAVTPQAIAQIDQLAKSKQAGFAGFAKCTGLQQDKDGVDNATLCTQGQMNAAQKQTDDIKKEIAGIKLEVAPGKVMPGGGGPVQIGILTQTGLPGAGLQVGGLQQANPALSTGLPVLPAMGGNAPAMQTMGASLPGGAPGASNTSGSIATPNPSVPTPASARVGAAASPMGAAITLGPPATRSITPDAVTLRGLIAAGCRQPNAATPGAISCSSDAALAQCVAAQRESKVNSCTLQR